MNTGVICHYVIVLAVVSVIVTSANTVAIVTASVLSYLLPSFSHTLLYTLVLVPHGDVSPCTFPQCCHAYAPQIAL